MGRASKDKRDIYYRKAKEEGFRARSAYKLLQIHEEFNILDPAQITAAVDLCAAPGSWSQVLASLLYNKHKQNVSSTAGKEEISEANVAQDTNSSSITTTTQPVKTLPPRIVAVDLQEMAPIEGVTFVQGDITEERTAREVIRLLNCDLTETDKRELITTSSIAPALRMADIVVCDGAPDVTGMHELDEYLQHHLLLAALHIASCVLRRGGTFVTKMFRGPATPFLIAKAELFFRHVRLVKPFSSRNASMECFLLGQDFALPPGYVPRFATSKTTLNSSHTPNTNEKNEEEGEGGLRVSGYAPEAPVYIYTTTNSSSTTTESNAHSVSNAERVLLPFLACGDLSGFDADMCYDRAANGAVLPPVHPPLQAPYLSHYNSEKEEEAGQGVLSGGCDDEQRKKPRTA